MHVLDRMLHLIIIFISVIVPFTKTNQNEISVEVISCNILKVTLLGGLPITELYIYQVINRTGNMEQEFAYYFSEDEHHFESEINFNSYLSKLIDKQKSNSSQIAFKHPNLESQIKLLMNIETSNPSAFKLINLQFDNNNNCIYIGKRYLEIKIIDCDILHFKMKNTAEFVFNDVYIYEVGPQKKLLYHYNLESNTTIIGSYLFGLFISRPTGILNYSTIKLMKPQINIKRIFNITIDVVSASGIHYMNQSCITYEPLTKCFNSDCMVINVSFTPVIPEKDHRFCIKVWYTNQKKYFLDRLLFQAQNISEENNIYKFNRSSSNDPGQRIFNEQSAWASRVDKTSNLSIDTVCFIKVEPMDINVTFYWNIRLQNRNNKSDQRNFIHQFQITNIIEQDISKDSSKLEYLAFLIILIFPIIYIFVRYNKNVNSTSQMTSQPEELNEMLSGNKKNDKDCTNSSSLLIIT